MTSHGQTMNIPKRMPSLPMTIPLSSGLSVAAPSDALQFPSQTVYAANLSAVISPSCRWQSREGSIYTSDRDAFHKKR